MSRQTPTKSYKTLRGLANRLRKDLDEKRFLLLYAYNGTGKTRLSRAFKAAGNKNVSRRANVGDTVDTPLTVDAFKSDTLYFNAFTEDLFTWDNDLKHDAKRVLRLNQHSQFFAGLKDLEMENRIGPLLGRYADFNFFIDYDKWEVTFFRDSDEQGDPLPIKVSRGEENTFIWCFFLAVAQLAIDEHQTYQSVKYLYIDDPISSLDDNNAIAVAGHLAQMLKSPDNKLKVVLSSHHTLFYNVMCNELSRTKQSKQYFLSRDKTTGDYSLRYTGGTPFFHHVALLQELHKAADSGALYTYHFNILRNILEKTASFHGFSNFSACIKQDDNDPDGLVHTRMVNILSHGNYSLYDPLEMVEENKGYFRKILADFMANYRFNPQLFPATQTTPNP